MRGASRRRVWFWRADGVAANFKDEGAARRTRLTMSGFGYSRLFEGGAM
jgi:hypothetical protein